MPDLERINAYMKRVAESGKKTFKPAEPVYKCGLDLGTAYIVLVVLDKDDNPVVCEEQAADVLRDGVVVDYAGALKVVKELKTRAEKRLEDELVNCAIAMPAGTLSSVRTHRYVAEGAGFEVTNILDEPSAANSIYCISNGAVVDIGGGTTGLAVLNDGVVTEIYAEPTGGIHLTLVIAGNYHIPVPEAEKLKTDFSRHREMLPVVKAVIEKMATIVMKHIDRQATEAIYLCGGTSCFTDIETVFENVTGIRTVKTAYPLLVTPAGIAVNCKV